MRPFAAPAVLIALGFIIFSHGAGVAQPPAADPDLLIRADHDPAVMIPLWNGSNDLITADPGERGRYIHREYGYGLNVSSRENHSPDHHARSLSHLIESHGGAVIRPISTLGRLVSMAAYIGLDALRPSPKWRIPDGPPPPIRLSPGMDLAAWEMELDAITGSKSLPGTLELLIDGDEFFPRLERSITDAEKSVDLQIYIFDNDDYALNFARLLRSRSLKVDIRVLMDGLGSIMARGVNHETQPVYHTPPASLLGYLEKGSGVRARQLPNPWITFDHTKSIIVDSATAFMGGMNIGREYRYAWHDMMVQVEGPAVAVLQEEFSKTWDYAGFAGDFAFLTSYEGHVPESTGHTTGVRVLKTGIGRCQIYRAQLAAIRRAQSYIYIQNPYLSDDVILYELIRARHRGVDVRVVLPRDCNWGAMARSNVLAANEMLAHDIKVYFYPGMSHVKAAVIDGWACIGSANLDKASLRFNREINLATSYPGFVRELVTRLFEKDFAVSELMGDQIPEKQLDWLYERVADLM